MIMDRTMQVQWLDFSFKPATKSFWPLSEVQHYPVPVSPSRLLITASLESNWLSLSPSLKPRVSQQISESLLNRPSQSVNDFCSTGLAWVTSFPALNPYPSVESHISGPVLALLINTKRFAFFWVICSGAESPTENLLEFGLVPDG